MRSRSHAVRWCCPPPRPRSRLARPGHARHSCAFHASRGCNWVTTNVCTHWRWLCACRSLLKRRGFSLWWTRTHTIEFAVLPMIRWRQERHPLARLATCQAAARASQADTPTGRPRRPLGLFEWCLGVRIRPLDDALADVRSFSCACGGEERGVRVVCRGARLDGRPGHVRM